MRTLILLVLGGAACLFAADFWTSKPYTDWTPKEVQKLMSDSPWARRADVPLSVKMPPGTSQSEGGGRGRGSRGSGPGEIATADGGQSAGADLTGTRGGPAGPGTNDGPMTQSMPVLLIWESSAPIKEAIAKAKYGAEAGTSAEAKAYLEHPEEYLVLNVAGLPASAEEAGEGENKAALLKSSTLSAKGKTPLNAVQVQFTKRERMVDAVFFFPRAAAGSAEAFSAEDKELEFSAKFDKLPLKYRFKLKDMVYHGKLEL
jgi:hypothetical protein